MSQLPTPENENIVAQITQGARRGRRIVKVGQYRSMQGMTAMWQERQAAEAATAAA